MTYEEYDYLPGLRASGLKRLRESPLHYRAPPKETSTPARGMLRAIHCAVLEPETYSRDYAVFDGVRRGRNYDAFVARKRGATILNPREAGVVDAVAGHILRHPVAGPFFAGEGEAEVTIRWRHPGTGIGCKARLDRLTKDSAGRPALVDLKSYGTTDERIVCSRVVQLGAHIQMAHYEEGLRIALGIEGARVLIVSAEVKQPYDVAVFVLERDAALLAGQIERERLMARLDECLREDRWPGRHEGIQPLPLPAWVAPDDGSDAVEDGEYE
jgi:hypothetical protein